MREQVMEEEADWGQRTASVHRSELEFHRLLEKLPAGAYTCDPEGLITYFNQHAVELWGRAPKLNDAVDRFCGSFKLFATDGSPLAHDKCWMALALQTEKEFNGHEIIIERPNGERLTALAHANPIRTKSGKLLGAVNVLVDISDRKRAEDALKEADRYKNEFLATLAHELRNPLAPIRNAVQILHLQGAPSPEVRWAVDLIDRQAQQMTRLIDDLLDISRITYNKLELHQERIDVSEILNVAVETSRPLIEACGQKLVVTAPPQPIYLDADLTRLAQAISNLLNNASKYTDRNGHISLTAARQGNDAVITVRDTGNGIPTEMLPRIFDMFTQADRSRGGIGIGLTLVKRLVEMHGGTITAHSHGPGTGSEFTVRLPAVNESSQPIARASRESKQAVPISSLRILVVDDNRDSAASLGTLLQIMGNDIRIAHDGLEALDVAQDFQPNVILLDIGLPKMNGYDTARKIRQQPWGKKTFLIAVTGWGQETDRRNSAEAGFDQHLIKPVDPAALIQSLASLEQTLTKESAA